MAATRQEEKMKLSVSAALVITAVLLVPCAAMAGFGARLTGGLTHISYSDYNDWADDVNASAAGLTEIDNINWVPEFGAEVFYPFSPMIEIAAGAGMISGSADLSYSVMTSSLSIEHKMKAYPFSLNAYFRPSVPFASIKPFLYGGGALYYSKLDFGFRMTDSGISDGYDAELTTWGFGLQGGGGIEFSIAPTVSLEIGFRLRWADLDGYEGTATSLDGETRDIFLVGHDDDRGFLYGPEDVSEKDNYDEGSVGLSGYSIVLGIKAGF